jgi:uncharacterized protein YggU (UPF0235/DUF167 family)
MYIHVCMRTKQKAVHIEKINDTKFIVSVKEDRKQNQANSKLVEVLGEYFNNNNIKIVSGHHSFSKLLAIGD